MSIVFKRFDTLFQVGITLSGVFDSFLAELDTGSPVTIFKYNKLRRMVNKDSSARIELDDAMLRRPVILGGYTGNAIKLYPAKLSGIIIDGNSFDNF